LDALAKRNPIIHPSICRKNKLKWLGRQTKTLEVGLDKLRKIMRKIFLILLTVIFAQLSAQNSVTQKFAESFTAFNYDCYSIPAELRAGFYSSLTSVKSNEDLLTLSRNYLSEEKSIELVNDFTALSEAIAQLKQSGYDENDLKAKLLESEIYPVQPCNNRAAYDNCMSGVMEAYNSASWTFVGATLSFAAVAISTEGVGLFLGAAGYGIAINEHNNAMDKRNKGMGDCYNTHCLGLGGGPGMPSGGIPKPRHKNY